MSLTKYRACAGNARIDVIEVIKESEQAIWLPMWQIDTMANTGPGRRTAKRSNYDNYFDTWAEAHAFLMQEAASRVLAARRELEEARSHEGNVKGMKPPVSPSPSVPSGTENE